MTFSISIFRVSRATRRRIIFSGMQISLDNNVCLYVYMHHETQFMFLRKSNSQHFGSWRRGAGSRYRNLYGGSLMRD